MSRAQFHVVPDGDRWKVEHQGRKLSDHETQQQAIRAARGQARTSRPSQLLIHDQNGQVEDESTYDNDPFPPRGEPARVRFRQVG